MSDISEVKSLLWFECFTESPFASQDHINKTLVRNNIVFNDNDLQNLLVELKQDDFLQELEPNVFMINGIESV